MAESIEKLVDEYWDGRVTRREFLQRAAVLTGSLAAATSLLDSLLCPADAAQVDPNDRDLVSGMVQFPGPAGAVFGYQSRPRASGKYPAIAFIHENRGMEEHNQDVARRLAKQGFLAISVDYLSRQGGTAKVNSSGGDVDIRKLAPPEVIKEDTQAAITYLQGLPEVRSDRIGLMGFCWGGEMAFYAATQVRGVRALVIFYGRSPKPLDLIQQIEGPVLVHYGELDKGITSEAPQVEEAMKKYNKSFEYKIYPGAGHAFYNDLRPERHNAQAAKEAWGRTLEFFKKYLQS